MLLPARARMPRAYYQGKDQLEWGRMANSGDANARQTAIDALCEILRTRPTDSFIRDGILHCLVEARATEAIPLLEELYDDGDADLRHRAREAAKSIQAAPLRQEAPRD